MPLLWHSEMQPAPPSGVIVENYEDWIVGSIPVYFFACFPDFTELS